MTIYRSTFSPLFHIFPQGYATLWINSARTGKVSTAFAAQIRSHSEPVLFPGVRIPPDERYSGTISLAPRIYEGGGPRSGRGSPPPQRGKPPQSRLRRASSPRGEAEGAPFLPPAFMRGEGHAVAGGVLRRGGESLLSHGCAVPAPPEGKPRAFRAVLAPRIYEGGGPRSGGGSLPPQRGKLPQSRLRRASSPRGEAEGASHRSCPPHL